MNRAPPDLAALEGIHIVPTIEPRVGAPLGVELGHRRRRDIAIGVDPAGIHTHADDAKGKMPRDDGIDQESVLTSIPVAEADGHPGVERGGRESLDLRQARQLDLSHGARPVIEGAVPCGDEVGVEEEFGHGVLPGGRR